MGKQFHWTEELEEELKQMWNKHSLRELSIHFHATTKNIEAKAAELNLPLYKSNRWTKEEEDLLREYAKDYITKEIADKLGKSVVAINKKALKLGIELHFEKDPWDDEKIAYLKANINKIPIGKIEEKLDISYCRIVTKCKKLGIEYLVEDWTEEEIATLREYAQKCHYTELTKVLPRRSVGAISAKAYTLGIETISDITKLNDTHAEFIKKNWGKIPATEIARQLKISLGVVYRYKKELGLPNLVQKKKYTDKIISKIKRDAKTMTTDELAKKYKTTAPQITRIASENNITLIDSKKIWTDELDEELTLLVKQKLTVKEIAEKMNIKVSIVRNRMVRLGLDKKRTRDPRYNWTDEQVKLLKSLSEDKNSYEIAKALNKTEKQVYDKARKLGIKIISGKNHLWTEADTKKLLELYEKFYADELAKEMNRSEETIRYKAKELGITLRHKERKRWTAEEESKLRVYAKEYTIKEIAYFLDRSEGSVSFKLRYMGLSAQPSSKFWTEEELNQLIALSETKDANEIAMIMGKSYEAVMYESYALGIKVKSANGKTWTEEEEKKLLELLKLYPSGEVAKMLNRSEDAVMVRAVKLGYKSNEKHKKWTIKDDELLTELWGYRSIETIAERLNRTVYAIRNRASVLELGSQISNNYNGITLTDLSKIFKVNSTKISTSWMALGLKLSYRKRSNGSRYAYVTIEDLFEFLEKNQDMWDSKILEKNILGEEPVWLQEKRKKDRDIEYKQKSGSVTKHQLMQAKKYLLDIKDETSNEEPPKRIKLDKPEQ